ncbi:hypothetical protein AhnVgp109 [Adoxophyes honmai nucleopolyhedrovirus]|uniref:Poly(ADP-ribose) glycohydrolase n=1 Tax=Adoxophyes honmai nucleopolyhedrovirus TaxID=224399 RepID=Q80LI7_NPVAH|nr:hypothetical protein AhnVgp109 [Adoxophyes honmai nucleopolyhedrovirus]BAC67360.1 hypothetical protein [Adoxophyes honmai nucleopolyhedrovirus]
MDDVQAFLNNFSELQKNILQQEKNYKTMSKSVKEILNEFNKIEQSLRSLLTIKNTLGGELDHRIFKYLQNDKLCVTLFSDLLKVNINASVDSLPTMIAETFNRVGQKFNITQFINFEYLPELTLLLQNTVIENESKTNISITRMQLASIAARAFFCRDIPHLIFDKIRNDENNAIMQSKKICILNYFYLISKQIHMNDTEFLDCELIMSYQSNVPMKKLEGYFSKNNILFEQLNALNLTRDTIGEYDLIHLYTCANIGQFATEDSVKFEDLVFMAYPELYVTKYFFPNTLENDGAVIIQNLIRCNNVNMSHPEQISSNNTTIYANFVWTRNCDSPQTTGNGFSNQNYIDTQLTRYNNAYHYYRLSVGEESFTVFSMPHGSYSNKQFYEFQFLIELLVVINYDIRFLYNWENQEQKTTLLNMINYIPSNMSLQTLYNKLINWNFNLDSIQNLK